MQQSAPSEPPLVNEGQRPGGQQLHPSQEDEGVGTPVVNNKCNSKCYTCNLAANALSLKGS